SPSARAAKLAIREIEVSGDVRHETLNEGSKSEHDAVVLATPDGTTYVLTRPGANPFEAGDLEMLVGHSIVTRGLATGRTLLMKDWHVTGETMPGSVRRPPERNTEG